MTEKQLQQLAIAIAKLTSLDIRSVKKALRGEKVNRSTYQAVAVARTKVEVDPV